MLREKGVMLQSQSYDHVLRREERAGDEFEDTVLYIRKNPERAGLVREWSEWPYSGVVAPGYPDLPVEPLGAFWKKFWTVYHREVENHFRGGTA
jgi:putative transposase